MMYNWKNISICCLKSHTASCCFHSFAEYSVFMKSKNDKIEICRTAVTTCKNPEIGDCPYREEYDLVPSKKKQI